MLAKSILPILLLATSAARTRSIRLRRLIAVCVFLRLPRYRSALCLFCPQTLERIERENDTPSLHFFRPINYTLYKKKDLDVSVRVINTALTALTVK